MLVSRVTAIGKVKVLDEKYDPLPAAGTVKVAVLLLLALILMLLLIAHSHHRPMLEDCAEVKLPTFAMTGLLVSVG